MKRTKGDSGYPTGTGFQTPVMISHHHMDSIPSLRVPLAGMLYAQTRGRLWLIENICLFSLY